MRRGKPGFWLRCCGSCPRRCAQTAGACCQLALEASWLARAELSLPFPPPLLGLALPTQVPAGSNRRLSQIQAGVRMWQARKRYQERLRYFRRNVSEGWGLRALPTATVRSWGPLNAWPSPQVCVGWLERREKLLRPRAGLGERKSARCVCVPGWWAPGGGEERKTAPVRSKASRGFEIASRGERRVRGRCLLPVGT